MAYKLSRFVEAQENVYPSALAEIRAGRKTNHWIWYIFPQLKTLGSSTNAKFYGLESLDEARAYLENETLAANLKEISQALLDLPSSNPQAVMGSNIDALKLRSSMTLFALADPTCDIFQKVLDKYFGGRRDELTVTLARK